MAESQARVRHGVAKPGPFLVRILALACFACLVPVALRAQAASRAAAQGGLPTIEEKTAGMQKLDGFFPLYHEESAGRLWMEIARFDTEVLYVTGLASGLGSNDIGLDRGMLQGSRIVVFERRGPRVLMVQPNYRFRATSPNPAEVKAVTDAFARSVLWGFTAAAVTGPRVLVDLTEFLIRDTGIGQRLRPGTYRLEPGRSSIYLPMTRAFPANTEIEAELTFAAQPGGGGFGGGAFFEGVASVAASGEAASLRVHHSLVQLPDARYTPRTYDPRSGFGDLSWEDYAAPLGSPMTQRWTRRHRLEKVNPGAAMSDPVRPIVYYLDPGAPEPIRSALLEGARWWNQAFEAAGYRNAFRVELRPDSISSLDARYNVINWVHRSTRGWSTGGSVTDPRTGEIIKGVVTLGSLRIRQDYLIAEGLLSPYRNGDETPPELAEWGLARIRQLAAHEVGHTLGFGHNYYDSRAGRISVMDYPHPWVTLRPDGSLDFAQVYERGIGEWDSVAVTWGYQDFPAGTDEETALAKILDDAWARDLRYMTNQDMEANPLVDQWSNGTDAAAELNRMMDVRRAALARFGQNAIPNGAPMATMEEVLVPLYLHHRYQVEAAASALGGIHYIYSLRGDGREPLRMAPPAEQRAALDALLATLQPAALAIPDNVLRTLPPRPAGFGRSRELFPRYTGDMFDVITPAVVAADHTVANILDPERAARMVQQHALEPAQPGLDDVIARLVDATFGARTANPYQAEIRRAVERVVADHLMALAADAPMPQVRAIANLRLATLMESAGRDPAAADPADAAHRILLAQDIKRFIERPAQPAAATTDPAAPPGAPIGDPGMDWLAYSPTRQWLRSPSAQAWLRALHEPACSLDGSGSAIR
jgi:hypothetical protein